MSTAPAQTVALPFESSSAPEAAAKFIAELVRQGVTFRAYQDFGAGPSGIGTQSQIVIQFLGGF